MNNELRIISTGYKNLDSKLSGGFIPGNLVTIASRPSMGKSSFAFSIASNIAKSLATKIDDKCNMVGLFSSTPNKDAELLNKAEDNGCFEKNIVLSSIYGVEFMVYDNMFMATQLQVEKDNLTIESIKERARILKENGNLRILFVDDIQLIKFKGSEELDLDNKFSYISSSLKNLATDLKITIVITYPIIDEVDKDKNDIPILSDFSYADSIANDSDIVIFLHREEVYLRQNEPEINDILSYGKWKNQLNKSLDITDCIVAKYRNGFNSRTKMLYIDSVSKFIDLERVKSNEK